MLIYFRLSFLFTLLPFNIDIVEKQYKQTNITSKLTYSSLKPKKVPRNYDENKIFCWISRISISSFCYKLSDFKFNASLNYLHYIAFSLTNSFIYSTLANLHCKNVLSSLKCWWNGTRCIFLSQVLPFLFLLYACFFRGREKEGKGE